MAYSFTLHSPDGTREFGFDNAHASPKKGAGFKKRQDSSDHWHRSRGDSGEPYDFVDAATLVDDFFDEVEQFMTKLGLSTEVIAVEEKGGSK